MLVPLLTIFHQLQSTRFYDLKGTDVAATIPVSERLINQLVAASLPQNRHLREVRVHPDAGNRFEVRLAPRAAMLPSITIKLEIERQPDLPRSAELVLRMATMSGLFAMATAALPIAQMLPPGVRLEGEHIHVDLRTIAARGGAAGALSYLRELRITTEAGKAVLHLKASV